LTGPAVSAASKGRGGGQRGRSHGGRGRGNGGGGRGHRSRGSRGMTSYDSALDNRFALLTFDGCQQ